MATGSRAPRLIALVAVALLFGYVLTWLQVTRAQIGRSDFTATYVGATLLRTGHATQMYNEALQAPLHRQLIAPDTEGNLPFVDAPLAAAVAAPVTLLDLHVAYWVWSLLQLLVLVGAVLIALRAAPWPPGIAREWQLAAALLALAGAGTMVQLLQAQWGPVTALAFAVAYHEWRFGRHFRGALFLVVLAGIAKPHLAIGVVVFLLGWRQRRVLLGALAGTAGVVGASVAVAGARGLVQFVQLAIVSNTRWQLRTFSSFVGIPGSFLGNSGVAQVIGAGGSVLALALAYWLGTRVRVHRGRLDIALAGAIVLSLLATPHVGTHDLVVLAPAVAWSLAGALRLDRSRLRRADHGLHPVAAVVGLAALITVAALLSLADGTAIPPGQLTPWALLAAAAAVCIAIRRSAPIAEHPLPSRRDEAALGTLANGLRRRHGVARG